MRDRWFSRIAVLLTLFAAVFITSSCFADEEYLQPDDAFQFSARMIDGKTLAATFRIADAYYLYRERFKFSADIDGQKVPLGDPVYPKGEIKFDETFQKDVEHYRNQVVVRIPIKDGTPRIFNLNATYQGCADAGLCYVPIDKTATIDLALYTPGTSSSGIGGIDESSRITATLKGGNLFAIAAIFIGLGVLLSFTPCVLPMLPILSAIIVGQTGATAPKISRGRGFMLALTYALGMALIYTLMGIAAGLAGEGLAAALQNVWVLSAFALLLVVLSLSMFGVYELQIPNSIQTRLTQWSGQLGGGEATGKWVGVFLMGAISALIVGPCVAAPLAGTLIYISQTRNVVVGGLALFALAAGMSVPLLLLGLSAGSILPRVGAWMNTVKRFFGVLLLAVAVWIVAPVLPSMGRITAWVSGSTAAVKPSASLIQFERIRTSAELDQRLQNAGKPVMLDFYADWCVSCKEMEHFTYTDPRVAEKMKGYVLLQVDVTDNTADDKVLLKRFDLFGPPGILFFDRTGQPIPGARIIGYQNADKFLESLKQVGS